jgi:hypothetical protein
MSLSRRASTAGVLSFRNAIALVGYPENRQVAVPEKAARNIAPAALIQDLWPML